MTRISATTRPGGGGGAPRVPVSSTPGFSLPSGPETTRPATNAASPSPAAGILTLQEIDAAPTDPHVAERQNQKGRDRGHSILALLTALQRDLLASDSNQATLDQLNALIDAPHAADPALNRILGAIACRAAIEIARRRPG